MDSEEGADFNHEGRSSRAHLFATAMRPKEGEDYTPTWKRDNWTKRPINWNKTRGKYEEVIPYHAQEVNELLRRADRAPAFYAYKDYGKQFKNPDADGYGPPGTPWPFDFHRALHSDGYRRGVWNAMCALWTADNWKAATQRLLDRVWRVRRRAATMVNKYRTLSFEEALKEQEQYNAF